MAQVNLSNNPDIDGVLCGFRWDAVNLTYSFPAGTDEYSTYAPNGIVGFEAFSTNQRAAINVMVANVNSVCNLTLAPAAAGSVADIRFAEATTVDYSTDTTDVPHIPGFPNNSAEASMPGATISARTGDCWFNRTNYNGDVGVDFDIAPGSFGYTAGLMHELGHALGLDHGHQVKTAHGVTFQMLPADHDTQEYSVMTYRRYASGPTIGAVNADYPQTLMQNDIAALQHMYGARFSTNSNGTVYRWAPFDPTRTDDGELFINGVSQGLATDDHILMTIWDDGGLDTYDFSNYTTNLRVDLNPGAWTTVSTAQLAFLGADDGTNHFARGNIANALLYRGDVRSLIENAVGGSGHDTITGNAAANLLQGGIGNDTLRGNGGFDVFHGGVGRDVLDGGLGTDTVAYFGAAARVTADLTFFLTNTGDAAGDEYESIENLRGSSFHDILRGDDEANVIDGIGGHDTLLGRDGSDVLRGGNGNDVLNGGPGPDAIDGGAGIDTVAYGANSAVQADLLSSVFNTGDAFGDSYSGIENLSGSAFGDVLTGDNLVNVIAGGNGNDVLNGRGGRDNLQGGIGNDVYVLADLSQLGGIGSLEYDTVMEVAGAGLDKVFVTALDTNAFGTDRYSLGTNLESGTVVGTLAFNLFGNELSNVLTGNEASNQLTGNAGHDTLLGRGGFDRLQGGIGNDVYLLSDLSSPSQLPEYDAVIEAAGGGIDTVIVTALDANTLGRDRYTLGANVENGTIVGALAFDLTGNALANSLTGNGATNTLNGLGGADPMSGLGGGDFYFVDNAGDKANEAAGGGNDRVYASVSYTLAAATEIETLSTNDSNSTAAIDLIGNALANVIGGNAGNNFLNGGGGTDTLEGLGGADRYLVDSANDVIKEMAGGGSDTVIATSSYSLAAGQSLEVLTAYGSASTYAASFTGNAIANTLLGNAATNVLNGAAGSDTLTGFNGKDVFVFNTALNATTNLDRITDFSVVDDFMRLENGIFAGLATGVLAATAFRIGAAAADVDDRIIYNAATGTLIYDSNGSAAGGAVQFATLAKNLALTNADFVVI